MFLPHLHVASRLKTAAAGSSGFVIFPSGVTITRSHNDCSSAFSSHLIRNMYS
ncbi:hypothetical protein Hdeb2414_s0001g00032261 [Helianthus debilis subsp. tardiflorus]